MAAVGQLGLRERTNAKCVLDLCGDRCPSRPFVSDDPRPAVADLDPQARAVGDSRLRRRGRFARGALERARRRRVKRSRRVELLAEALDQCLGCLATERNPLAAGAQPVERRRGSFASTSCIRELLLGARTGSEELFELCPEPAPDRGAASRRASASARCAASRARSRVATAARRRAISSLELPRPGRRRWPGARADASACAPRPRGRAPARPAWRRAQASARRGDGGA